MEWVDRYDLSAAASMPRLAFENPHGDPIFRTGEEEGEDALWWLTTE